jgi:hypothetical protein
MSETAREFAANYRKPLLHTRFKKSQSGNPHGRPVKTGGTPGRGAEREGDGYRERQAR